MSFKNKSQIKKNQNRTKQQNVSTFQTNIRKTPSQFQNEFDPENVYLIDDSKNKLAVLQNVHRNSAGELVQNNKTSSKEAALYSIPTVVRRSTRIQASNDRQANSAKNTKYSQASQKDYSLPSTSKTPDYSSNASYSNVNTNYKYGNKSVAIPKNKKAGSNNLYKQVKAKDKTISYVEDVSLELATKSGNSLPKEVYGTYSGPKESQEPMSSTDWSANYIEYLESDNKNLVFINTNTFQDGDKIIIGNPYYDDEEYLKSQPLTDPFALDDFSDAAMEEDNGDIKPAVEIVQGSSQDLCIIPVGEHPIPQVKKDVVASVIPSTVTTNAGGILNSTEVTINPVIKPSTTENKNQDKYLVCRSTDASVNACEHCCMCRKSRYVVLHNTEKLFLCDDSCFRFFKAKYQDKIIYQKDTDLRVNKLPSKTDIKTTPAKKDFQRKCTQCATNIDSGSNSVLSWQLMEFCNKSCLATYLKTVGTNCVYCKAPVQSIYFGKFCEKLGRDLKQFCSQTCLTEYKKFLIVCTYCQKDITHQDTRFLTPVNDKKQREAFCTHSCMSKYNICNNREEPVSQEDTCCVCFEVKPIIIEFTYAGRANLLCSNPCFIAFKFVNNIESGKCSTCKKYFDNKILEENTVFYKNEQHSFCSKNCFNNYIISNKVYVTCKWCKTKKYNFDMIKYIYNTNQEENACSLDCLHLLQTSLTIRSCKIFKCDHCQKLVKPTSNISMADTTVRHFCDYKCEVAFQEQFAKHSKSSESSKSVSLGSAQSSKKLKATSQTEVLPATRQADSPTIPIIAKVESLADVNETLSVASKYIQTISPVYFDATVNTDKLEPSVEVIVKNCYIVKPAPLPCQRNVATMSKVIMHSKRTNTTATTLNKEIQTTEIEKDVVFVPYILPIPIFCPLPMYSLPFPVPIPFPLPIPVPIIIPITRKSTPGIMQTIQNMQSETPRNPLEAEILCMAKMIAKSKKEDNTDTDTNNDINRPGPSRQQHFSSNKNKRLGDNMPQKASKMGSELDESAIDLEEALTASTVTVPLPESDIIETVAPPQQEYPIIQRPSARVYKRRGRPPGTSGIPRKRGRRPSPHIDMTIPLYFPRRPAEIPDANKRLKHTIGVNTWNKWVIKKNDKLKGTSSQDELFKTEIRELTANELNYSLCLFVKEVCNSKANVLTPDIIYYLCLGIQQYLFENKRSDNIFYDSFYHQFTDCFDDIARNFSVLYDNSHYIVTRIEEEHLWETRQLGAYSPHILLNTLMFFNTKYFNLTTVEEHMQLRFSHIIKHCKRPSGEARARRLTGTKNMVLNYYPPLSTSTGPNRKVYEQEENKENPLRCPVRFYEYYLSKCPESVKTRNGVFYLEPERSCVFDSPMWYSTVGVSQRSLEKMLHRVKMVKEINVAFLSN